MDRRPGAVAQPALDRGRPDWRSAVERGQQPQQRPLLAFHAAPPGPGRRSPGPPRSAALEQAPDGATRTELRDRFGRNLIGGRLESALAQLAESGRVRREWVQGARGRPAEPALQAADAGGSYGHAR
jgi:hypothetical protein